jgi:hypothetical protein
MTLLVAAVEDGKIWMAADTSITNPALGSLRQINQPKIYSIGNCSLIGFAGDVGKALVLLKAVGETPHGCAAIAVLLAGHIESGCEVDFAYGFFDCGAPRLFKISDGVLSEVQTLYLGQLAHFEKLQQIRHDKSIDHPPDAIVTFVFGVAGEKGQGTPQGLMQVIVAMHTMFVTSSDRSVGGVAIPYLLSGSGVKLCAYAFSATDSSLAELLPGTIITQGSPQLGGCSLSVTELLEHDGLVIYWLQKPGGSVFLRSANGYDQYDFDGNPTLFKNAVKARLGRKIDLWFGGQTQENKDVISMTRIMKDQEGRPRIGLTTSGDTFSFSWIQNTEESFKASETVSFEHANFKNNCVGEIGHLKLVPEFSEDKRTVALGLGMEGEKLNVSMSANELEILIGCLARIRAVMQAPVLFELAAGTELRTVIDPRWRTRPTYHVPVDGVLLALRDPGLGWLSYLLPIKEAATLGEYLSTASSKRSP